MDEKELKPETGQPAAGSPPRDESGESGLTPQAGDTISVGARETGGAPTIVPAPGGAPAGPPAGAGGGASFGTVMISSSSKAKARIRVCESCNLDNPVTNARCAGCGADLLEQERKRSERGLSQQMEQLGAAAAAAPPSDWSRTIMRDTPGTPQPEVPVERKSVYSQYVPTDGDSSGSSPQAFNAPSPGRPVKPPSAPAYLPPQPQYRHQDPPVERSQTSLVVGIAIAAALLVVFAGLVATLIVVILK